MPRQLILPSPTLLTPEPRAESLKAVSGGSAFLCNAASVPLQGLALNGVSIGGPLAPSTLGPGSTGSGSVPWLSHAYPAPPFSLSFTYPAQEVLGTVASNLPAGANLIIYCFLNGFLITNMDGRAIQLSFSSS